MTLIQSTDRREAQSYNGSVKDYLDGNKRSFDEATGISTVKIFSGDWYVSTEGGEMLVTILGSCVSACIHDPVAGIGGMNHFLLPGVETEAGQCSESARYGVFAMESLLNGIFKAGGRKERLEVKVFGGGNVTSNSERIGSKNAAFIREFLRKEGYRIVSADLEGDQPRRLHYFTDSGKVMLRKINRKDDRLVIEQEARYRRDIVSRPVEGEVDLF